MPPRLAMKFNDVAAFLLHDQIEAMVRFADYIEQPIVDINNDKTFALIVRSAIERHRVDASMLATEFGLNRTTIGRWMSEKNAPQPMARPIIVSWILKQVRSEVIVLQAELDRVAA